MPAQSAAVNTDTGNKSTSAYYGDRGDGTSVWYQATRTFDGGDVTFGAKADSAITDPSATTATFMSFVKGLLTFLRVSALGLGKEEDSAHASGDTGVMMLGVRTDAGGSRAGANGDYSPILTDALGRVQVADRNLASVIATSALATNLVVKASAGRLFKLAGYSTQAQFIQVHDAASLPSDSAVPELVFPIAANALFEFEIPVGHGCSTGIVICNSSTGPTKTIGSADTWITAYYE